MKKIKGVESAKASLNEGRVRVVLKPGNSVRLEQIRKAVNEQGFTPKDARVKAVGDLIATDGRLQFKISGNNEVFPVMETPHAPWRKQVGGNLTVSAIVAEPPTDKEAGMMQITEISKHASSK